MVPKTRAIDITARTHDGKPLRGRASYPGRPDIHWEVDETRQGGILFTAAGQSSGKGFISREMAWDLKDAINLSERKRIASEKRRLLHMKDWPMLAMPALGEVVKFGFKKQAYTLPPEEHAFALDLREAARGGDDFAGMIASIEEAGFLVRPMISEKKDEGEEGYGLFDFRFSRDGINMAASTARMSITESTEIPRAPILARDGEWLLALRDNYDEIMRPVTLEIAGLRQEIEGIVEEGGTAREKATRLLEAGIGASCRQDDLNHMGSVYRRTRYAMERDDVAVRIVTPWEPDLARTARAMVKMIAEAEDPDIASISL